MKIVEDKNKTQSDNKKAFKILVVDDEPANLRVIEGFLIPEGYRILKALNGQEALEVVRDKKPDLVLMDAMMPILDGFETTRILKQGSTTRNIPIVMITALRDVEDRVRAIEVGIDDFLTKPVDKAELRARVRSLIKVKTYKDFMQNYHVALEAEVKKRTDELNSALNSLKEASLETVFRLSQAAEYRDDNTGGHIQRMSRYTVAIAKKMGLDKSEVEGLLYASPLHDVGKIAIPDHILLKPGKLVEKEWEVMKTHTTIGAEMLRGSKSEYLKLAEKIALTHHERWDGKGYPGGLKGEIIPTVGRISSVADVFDALISKRPYKEPFPINKAFSIIEKGRGSQFDPRIVEAFFEIKNEILIIRNSYAD